jgi:transcription elongation factor GreA
METNNDRPTLVQAVAKYLAASTKKIDETHRQELNNFIRWFGTEKVVSSDNLRENDIADYGESIAPTGTDYQGRVEAVKAFLIYARKAGWLSENLAAKLKVKKVKNVKTALKQRAIKKVPMTHDGFNGMQKELEELKAQRFKVIEDIRRAAADKDLKENAPYHAAREQKSHLDGRILEIEETIKIADIIEEKQATGLKVNLGNTVKLKDIDSGEVVEYALVSPREVDPFEYKISGSSPVGKAAIGRNEGETIEVTVPSGKKFHYLIVKIR